MQILDIIPLYRGVPDDVLHYFCADGAIERGALIRAPFGKRHIYGIVLEVTPLADLKANVKSYPYQLKNIHETLHPHYFNAHLNAVLSIAREYQVAPRKVLYSAFPRVFLDHDTLFRAFTKIEQPVSVNNSGNTTNTNIIPRKSNAEETQVIDAPRDERLNTYRTIIREQLSARKSVVCIFPTRAHIEFAVDLLSKGMHSNPTLLHGSVSSKKQERLLGELLISNDPRLILATPGFAGILNHRIGACIIDSETHIGYRHFGDQHFDVDYLIENLCKEHGIRCFRGDRIVRMDTQKRIAEGDILGRVLSTHFQGTIDIDVVEHTPDFKDLAEKIIANDVLGEIRSHLKQKKKVVVYAPRKGYANHTVCRDCGHVMQCPHCYRGLVYRKLQSSAQQRSKYHCYYCKESFDVELNCPHCAGHNLEVIGIGAERIYEYLEDKLAKSYNKFYISRDTAKTPVQLKKQMDEFTQADSGVLVATDIVLPYLTHVDLLIFPTVQSLLYQHDYRSDIDGLQRMVNFIDQTDKVIIQKAPDYTSPLLLAVSRGSWAEFLFSELEARRTLHYPPYYYYIILTIRSHIEDNQSLKKIIYQLNERRDTECKHIKTPKESLYVVEIKASKKSWDPSEHLYQSIQELREFLNRKGYRTEMFVAKY